MFASLGTAMLIYEAGLFFIVDQHDVRPIVKQMLVSLDGKVAEDTVVIIPDSSKNDLIILLTRCNSF